MSESRKDFSIETTRSTIRRFMTIFFGNIIVFILLCLLVSVIYNFMNIITYGFLSGLSALVAFVGGVILGVWSQLFMSEHEIYPYNKCLTIH